MLPVYNFSPRKQYCISYMIVYGLIFKIWLNSSITKEKKERALYKWLLLLGVGTFLFLFFFSTKLHLSKPCNGPHHSLYMASYHSATSLSSRLVSIQSNWNFKIAKSPSMPRQLHVTLVHEHRTRPPNLTFWFWSRDRPVTWANRPPIYGYKYNLCLASCLLTFACPDHVPPYRACNISQHEVIYENGYLKYQ